MLKIKSSHGITIIELLLIVAIMLIISVTTASFGTSFLVRNNLKNNVNELISSLRTAQINAISSKEISRWGVNVSSDAITLYKGDSYISRDTNFDQDFSISETVSITQADMVFDKITGNPGLTQTYTLTNNIGESFSVSVNEVGIVDVN